MARTINRQERIAALVTELAGETAQLKEAEAAYKAEKDRLQAEMDEKLASLKTPCEDRTAKVAELREKITAEALKLDKKDRHPALISKDKMRLDYSDDAMWEFAALHEHTLLDLNKSNVERRVHQILRSKTDTLRFFGDDKRAALIPFPVIITKVDSIEFKGDLSDWLPKHVEESDAAEGKPTTLPVKLPKAAELTVKKASPEPEAASEEVTQGKEAELQENHTE